MKPSVPLEFPPIQLVTKGWGQEQIIVNKKDYCGKVMFFKAGKKCSYHYHKNKDEVFYLASGKMILSFSWGDDVDKAEQTLLRPGMKFEIPVGLRHQMYALEDSTLYEFSTHHEDSDSCRIVRGD